MSLLSSGPPPRVPLRRAAALRRRPGRQRRLTLGGGRATAGGRGIHHPSPSGSWGRGGRTPTHQMALCKIGGLEKWEGVGGGVDPTAPPRVVSCSVVRYHLQPGEGELLPRTCLACAWTNCMRRDKDEERQKGRKAEQKIHREKKKVRGRDSPRIQTAALQFPGGGAWAGGASSVPARRRLSHSPSVVAGVGHMDSLRDPGGGALVSLLRSLLRNAKGGVVSQHIQLQNHRRNALGKDRSSSGKK